MKRFKKGSPEAREYMAKLRAMRKGTSKGRKLKARGQARLRRARDIKRAMKADTWEGNVLPKARSNAPKNHNVAVYKHPAGFGWFITVRDMQDTDEPYFKTEKAAIARANKKYPLVTMPRKNPSGVRIVHNKLLGGWYVVRGPHQTPLNGRFDSKAEAQAWLNLRSMKSNPRCRNRGDTMFRCTAYFPKPSKPITHMLCAPNERVVKDEFWGILVRNAYDPDRSKFVIKAQPHLNPRKRVRKRLVKKETVQNRLRDFEKYKRTRRGLKAIRTRKYLSHTTMRKIMREPVSEKFNLFKGTRRRYIDATKNPVQKVRTRKLRDPDASLAKKSWVIFIRRGTKTFFYTGDRLNTELASAFPFRNKESALFHAQKLAKRFPQHEWGIKG